MTENNDKNVNVDELLDIEDVVEVRFNDDVVWLVNNRPRGSDTTDIMVSAKAVVGDEYSVATRIADTAKPPEPSAFEALKQRVFGR